MEEKNGQETEENNLYKCPHCTCCFCTDADLKSHMSKYGTLKSEHSAQFQKIHVRLERGSFNSSR